MEFNWISVLVTSLVPLVIGAVWYNKNVFGKAWLDSVGWTEENAQQGHPAMVYGLTLLVSFLISVFLFTNINFGGPESGHGTPEFTTFKHGAWHGAFLTVLIVFPIFLINSLFEGRSFKYIFVNVGYWLLNLVVMGGILSIWV